MLLLNEYPANCVRDVSYFGDEKAGQRRLGGVLYKALFFRIQLIFLIERKGNSVLNFSLPKSTLNRYGQSSFSNIRWVPPLDALGAIMGDRGGSCPKSSADNPVVLHR